jgi:hypothetical protein
MTKNLEQSVESVTRETEVLREKCHSSTLSTINSNWLDPVLNSGPCNGKLATNRQSYSTATSPEYGNISSLQNVAFSSILNCEQ